MTNAYHLIPAGQAGNTSSTGTANTQNPTAVTNNALGFFEQFEGLKPVQLSTVTPYPDSKGLPTVGLGWLLYDATGQVAFNTDLYLQEIGIPQTDPRYQAMDDLLNQKWLTGSGSPDYTGLTSALNKAYGGTVPGLTSTQISDLWNKVVLLNSNDAQYNKFINTLKNSHVNIDTQDFLNSKEGLALFTMSYNGALRSSDTVLKDLNSSNFNRADAWFQIRYNTNLGKSGAVAKRQYAVSEIFGLYSPDDTSGNVPDAEALSIYAEFSKMFGSQSGRSMAFASEYTYMNYPGSKGKIVNEITQANADLASSYISNDAPAIAGTTVATLEDELKPAANALIQHYVLDSTVNPYLAANSFTASSFDSLDVQVAATGGGNDLQALQRTGYQLGAGGYLSSLLVAQGGSDTLDGSGTANDVLIGGESSDAGNDAFYIGSGNDYIVAGSGNALIEGAASGGPIGNGNDTIVLGNSNDVSKGGDDTVYGGAGVDTYIIGKHTKDHIYLGSGQTIIKQVQSDGSVETLVDTFTRVLTLGKTEGYQVYVDTTGQHVAMVFKNSSGTQTVEIYDTPTSSGSASTDTASSRSLAASTLGIASNALALGMAATQASADLEPPESDTFGGELELIGFQGDDDAGIQLQSGPTLPTGADNLSSLRNGGVFGTTTLYYDDLLGGTLTNIFGTDTSATGAVNEINGEGNATYIDAGNGNNDVFIGDVNYAATNPLNTSGQFTVQGGSGNQLLVGVGNGHETIIGGDVGQDTTAWDTIDGGGADGFLLGGSQDSVIYGGTGNDTLVAGSGDSGSFSPNTVALAGLSFWGKTWHQVSSQEGSNQSTSSEPQLSIPTLTNPANFQINLALYQTDGTYAAHIGLLGSSLDSGVNVGASALPGSLLIGGSGGDDLIGNSGNDTLIGGTPSNPVVGQVDEVLVGGAGANLIYGGAGTEIIYADLGPGDVSNWADLDPTDSDTIYGGSGTEYIYGSGGNDVIQGGSGNYTIYVGNGNSMVDAGSGNTTINGGTGNDYIIAGSGTDNISTGDGDTYVYAGDGVSSITTGSGDDTIDAGDGTTYYYPGTGKETINLGASGGTQDLVATASQTSVALDFTSDVSSEDVIARRDNASNLVLTNEETGRQVIVGGYFSGNTEPSNVSITFGDGVTWGASQILQASMTPSDGDDELWGTNGNDTITGGVGNDTIIGVSGNNVLTGGQGNNTIQGGSGSDTIEGGAGNNQLNGGVGTETYVFQLGDGSDTINENYSKAGSDTLRFGTGIAPSDVTFAHGSSVNDLLIQLGAASTSTITITNFFAANAYQHQVENFDFSNGVTLSQAQVLQLASAINGTTGNDTLTGTSNAETFDGKGGNDLEIGNGGNDTFIFNAGYGHLEINESYAAGQMPILQLGLGISASALHVTEGGGLGQGLVLTDGVSGDQITIDQMLQGNFGVKEVRFADGSIMTSDQLIRMETTGTSGNDTLYGTSGADYFDGKGGDDIEYGNGGNDTFVFDPGYGQLTIDPYPTNGGTPAGNPIVQLGSGIIASALHVTSDGSSLILTDGVNGDLLTLQVGLKDISSASGDLPTLDLADGTAITTQQLIAMETTGTTGDDSLYGTSGADYFDGKGGNDYEQGYGGNDTFVFNASYGHLEINNAYSSGQQPILQLGPGINAGSLQASLSTSVLDSYDAGNLVLTDGISGDQITLDDFFGEGGAPGSNMQGVQVVQFSDGTTWTRNQLMQLASRTTGTTGNDTLVGTAGADVIDGKGGDDYAVGNGGNDTFVFNAGYGKLEINENYNAFQDKPVLQLGSGISASSLRAQYSNTPHDVLGLQLTDGAGDQIWIDGMYSTSDPGVQAVNLANGQTLTASMLFEMASSNLTAAQVLPAPSDKSVAARAGLISQSSRPLNDGGGATNVSQEEVADPIPALSSVSMQGSSASRDINPLIHAMAGFVGGGSGAGGIPGSASLPIAHDLSLLVATHGS